MTEQNPNYVPVDWTGQQEEVGKKLDAAEIFGSSDLVNEAVAEDWEYDGKVITSRGGANAGIRPPVKVGDRVHHMADLNQDERGIGVVTYVGEVEISGRTVANGCRCRWDEDPAETPHHVDLLTAIQ